MECKQIAAESLEEFVNLVAKDCIANLDDESKIVFLEYPEPGYHHFGYGMYIRNRYLWKRDSSKDKDPRIGWEHPDDLSHEIIKRIIQELQKEN